MKSILFLMMAIIFSGSAIAVDEYDIRAGTKELERACNQPGVDRVGSQAAHECIAAGKKVQENSDKLNREIDSSMKQREQDRQRIQQEEIWRQQIRDQSR